MYLINMIFVQGLILFRVRLCARPVLPVQVRLHSQLQCQRALFALPVRVYIFIINIIMVMYFIVIVIISCLHMLIITDLRRLFSFCLNR